MLVYKHNLKKMRNITKKIFKICGIIAIISCIFSFTSAPSTFAAYTFKGSCRDNFLGFVSWDCGVEISNQSTLKSDIWVIAGNIAADIAIAATYLIIGYVIYGGYLYTFSGGDPNKIATGKKTLLHAFIGLAITMSASVIVGSIRIALVGNNGNIGNCATGDGVIDANGNSTGGCVKPYELVSNLINWVTAVAGVVSAIFLVYGSIQYVTSAGDPAKLKRAKDTILYSLIGLAIVALTIFITSFISDAIRNANNDTASFNQTIISKEVHDHQIN